MGLLALNLFRRAFTMNDAIVPPVLARAPKIDNSGTYTVDQLAGILQCSPRHLWRQIDLNKIPGKIRCGRLVRFSRAVIDAWLAGEKGVGR
jgi:excisionase family DNA binding protein